MEDLGGLGGLVISLDFELYWGVRDRCTIADYGADILGAREAVPRLLDLFQRYDLACTWATVGFLFFDRREALLAALPAQRPAYADPRLSPYAELARIGPGERADPFRYALSLVRRIAATPRQEIATHTFSHFCCLEPGATPAAFRADLAAARAAAAAEGIGLESIVFPRNQVSRDHLAICREAGLIAYRGTEPSALYRPVPRSQESRLRRAGRLADSYLNLTGAHAARPGCHSGLVDLPASRFLRPWSPRLARLEPLRLERILAAMRRAAAGDRMFHLWFHPHNFGRHQTENLGVLQRIAEEAARLRERHGWQSHTMAGLARRTLARRAAEARSISAPPRSDDRRAPAAPPGRTATAPNA